jgi:hypothetical protein
LSVSLLLALGLCLTASIAFGQGSTDFKTGKPAIQSVSQLAFGPNGTMFVGDSMGAAVFAIETGDTRPATSAVKIDIKGVNQKIAAMLGIASDQLLINDVEVNPVSKNVYIAVSRGRGPDALPVILRVDGSNTITEFSLNNVRHASVALESAVANQPSDRPGRNPAGPTNANPRVDTITDMHFVDGKILVAGLSNEEFASDLRAIPFPFGSSQKGTGVRIWHASHGRYETSSPVRTFLPYEIDNKQHILAAYTCTPIVQIPVNDLKPGSKVVGKTIAEVGNSNRPLEMISYKKGGNDYILMANSMRGVMRFTATNLGSYGAITPPTPACEQASEPNQGPKECSQEFIGVPQTTLADMKGVWQLAKLDEAHALILTDTRGKVEFVPGVGTAQAPQPTATLDLVTIQLP